MLARRRGSSKPAIRLERYSLVCVKFLTMTPESNNPRRDMQDCKDLIPDQQTGSQMSAQAAVTAKDEMHAKQLFAQASERLLNPNSWDQLLKGKLGNFQVTDASGTPVQNIAQKGYYLRIDVKGPGTESGGGYDWVCIEDIKKCQYATKSMIVMRVRPARSPLAPEEPVAHFYDSRSTSTFSIVRKGNEVIAAIYDRNIHINTEGATWLEKLRNTIAGFFGKMAVSKIQWQDLADGLVA